MDDIQLSSGFVRTRNLTPRQCSILELLKSGESTKYIGHKLGISPCTVKVHLANLYAKFDVLNRTALVGLCFRLENAGHVMYQEAELDIPKKRETPKKHVVLGTRRHDFFSNVYVIRAKIIHGDTYGYDDLPIVINAETIIKPNCKTHGIFSINAYYHLDGAGCPKCDGSLGLT